MLRALLKNFNAASCSFVRLKQLPTTTHDPRQGRRGVQRHARVRQRNQRRASPRCHSARGQSAPRHTGPPTPGRHWPPIQMDPVSSPIPYTLSAHEYCASAWRRSSAPSPDPATDSRCPSMPGRTRSGSGSGGCSKSGSSTNGRSTTIAKPEATLLQPHSSHPVLFRGAGAAVLGSSMHGGVSRQTVTRGLSLQSQLQPRPVSLKWHTWPRPELPVVPTAYGSASAKPSLSPR